MMQNQGHASHYDILGVSPHASREEIENACFKLWYKYHILRATPLWEELNRRIDEIHATLLDSAARERYDRSLLEEAGAAPSVARATIATAGARSLAAIAQSPALQMVRAAKHRIKGLLPAGRSAGYSVATAPAALFNQLIGWMKPENWTDIQNIALITLALSLSSLCLLWSGYKLFEGSSPQTAEL